MIIQHAAMFRVRVHTLSTRPIHSTMTSQNRRASIRSTVDAVRVNIRSIDRLATADADGVLLSGGGHVGVVAAARARREEEVVVAVRGAVVDEGALLGVVRGAVEGDVVAGAGRRGSTTVHLNLEDISVEGAEVQIVLAFGRLDQVRVDGVVRLAAGGGDAGGAVVGPAAVLECARGCVANGRLFCAKGRDGIVHDICVANQMDVGGLTNM